MDFMQEGSIWCDLEERALGGPGKERESRGIKHSDETIKAGTGVFATSANVHVMTQTASAPCV